MLRKSIVLLFLVVVTAGSIQSWEWKVPSHVGSGGRSGWSDIGVFGVEPFDKDVPTDDILDYTDDIQQFGVNWSRPRGTSPSTDEPPGLVLPAFTGDEQVFGSIRLGDSADPEFFFAADLVGTGPDVASIAFYFDTNKNRNLTDDGPPISLTPLSAKQTPTFLVPYADGGNRPYSFNVYFYYSDFYSDYRVAYYRGSAWFGDVRIGPNTVPVVLLDDNSDGRYDAEGSDIACVDTNRDGYPDCFSGSNELITHFDPFFIDDAAYVAEEVSVAGEWVTFVEIPVGTLGGQVSSAAHGIGLSHAQVEAWQSIGLDTTATATGSYSLALPVGNWNVRASRPGHVPELINDVTVSSDLTTYLDFHLDPIPRPLTGTVTLYDRESYDFFTGEVGTLVGGEFYVDTDSPTFYANNRYQRGVQNLGDLGDVPLDEVVPPDQGYSRFGVEAVVGQTYAALGHEGIDGVIVFRVTNVAADSITLDYFFYSYWIFGGGFESGGVSQWSNAVGLVDQLLAWYPLFSDLVDYSGTLDEMSLLGNPDPPANPEVGSPLCQNGVYYLSEGGQDIRTPTISTLDASDFDIQVEFKITELPTFRAPIIVGGVMYRWIAIYVDSSGTMGSKYSGNVYNWTTTTIDPGVWYTAKLKFESGRLQMYLDGVLIQDITADALITGGNLLFVTNDYSNGAALNGCIRNLIIHNNTQISARDSSLDIESGAWSDPRP